MVRSAASPHVAEQPAAPNVPDEPEAGRLRLSAHAGRAHTLELVGLGLILALALMIRLLPMSRGLGFDELFTAVNFVGAESAWKTATTSINFNNHVGYSLLARLSVGLFGRSEWALRLPALLLGLATLPVLWWSSRTVVGPGVALAATLLLALAPEHIRWSTSARGYTALVLGTLVSSALLFLILRAPTVRKAAALVLVTAGTAYFHLHAIPVALVQGLTLLAWALASPRDPARRRAAVLGLAALAGAAALTVLLYLPILLPLLSEVSHSGRSELNPLFPWYTFVELLSVPSRWQLWMVFGLMALGVGSVALSVGRGPAPRMDGTAPWAGRLAPWIAGYAVALVTGPLLATTLARPLDLYPRFFIYGMPFAFVAVCIGCRTLARLLRQWLPTVLRPLAWGPALVVAVVIGSGWYALYPAAMTDEGFRAAVQALRADRDDDAPLCAFGAGAELFRWYSTEWLEVPKTVDELRRAFRGRGEPACAYRPASWESRGSAQIRAYLDERMTPVRYGEILVYRSD